MKKIIVAAILFLTIAPNYESTVQTNTNSLSYISDIRIEQKAADIRWRYKVEDNRIYRRQYDYTNQRWLGEWELL